MTALQAACTVDAMLQAARVMLMLVGAQAQPTFTTGPSSFTTRPAPSTTPQATPPGFTTTPGTFTTGAIASTTGQPGVANGVPTSFTTQQPTSFTSGNTSATTGQPTSFTTGPISNTTGADLPQGTGGFAMPWGRGRRHLHGDGVWVGRTFIATPDAPPPPPVEARQAYVVSVEQRLAAMVPRLDALKERVFAFNGDTRAALQQDVATLQAARDQCALAQGSMRDVVPQSFNAMKEEWDGLLASLEERMGHVEAALAVP